MGVKILDEQQALEALNIFNEKIQANKAYLSELDTPIGDGDHGANMARGMSETMKAIENGSPLTLSSLFKTVAMKLMSKVGGASGHFMVQLFWPCQRLPPKQFRAVSID